MAGRIIALANQKGGVGKTTTAINLAACLAEAGERALIVDLDPQANATSGLGEKANGVSSFDLLDGAAIAEIARPTRFRNLELVPARPDLAGAAVELSRHADGERYLRSSLTGARESYGYVFLDCPPSFGTLTVNALAAADSVIVPVQAEYYALEGLSQLLGSIELVKARLNPKLAHTACRSGRGRGAAAFRRSCLHDNGAALGPSCRGSEPRPPCDRVRPALLRSGGVLEGGDGTCRAELVHGAAWAAVSKS